MIKELIRKNRSYRRFYEEYKVSAETVMELVDLARNSASAANLQPLKYIISHEYKKNKRIFPCLAWAGYLKDWPGPSEGERPSAYIVILGDKEISNDFHCDHGIAAQSMLLGAAEKGLGGCIIGSIAKDRLRQEIHVPERYEILLVIALGKPKEEVVIEDISETGSIRYWRDERGVHHVPKRKLENIVLDINI